MRPGRQHRSRDRPTFSRVTKQLLSSGELAKELGISRRSVSRYADEGQISVALITPGGRYKFDPDTVREELRKMAQERRDQR